MWFDNNIVHVIQTPNNTKFLYSKGQLQSDGTINWPIVASAITTTRSFATNPSICVDSLSSNIWVAVASYDIATSGNFYNEVWWSSNGTTWSQSLNVFTPLNGYIPIIRPFTKGKLILMDGDLGGASGIVMSSYDGTAWTNIGDLGGTFTPVMQNVSAGTMEDTAFWNSDLITQKWIYNSPSATNILNPPVDASIVRVSVDTTQILSVAMISITASTITNHNSIDNGTTFGTTTISFTSTETITQTPDIVTPSFYLFSISGSDRAILTWVTTDNKFWVAILGTELRSLSMVDNGLLTDTINITSSTTLKTTPYSLGEKNIRWNTFYGNNMISQFYRTGDWHMENEMYWIEAEKLGYSKGLALLNEKGEVILVIDEKGNWYIKGKIKSKAGLEGFEPSS